MGRGEISLWGANWSGDILIGPRPMDLQLTVKNGIQMLEQLRCIISTEIHQKLRDMVLDPEKGDKLVFTLSEKGEFNAKAYGKVLFTPGPAQRWAKTIWHAALVSNCAGGVGLLWEDVWIAH